ncbi:MAG: HupE/UreJ family protein [Porphyrobacter sp.]|nr:HupE/UreJ family protein [Porphyrobacter sp.]
MSRVLCKLLALCLALLAAPASADELRPAVIELAEREGGAWVLEWKLPVAVSRGQDAAPLALPVFPKACTPVGAPVQRAAALASLGRQELRCAGDLAGQTFGLSELVGGADAIARVIPLERPAQTFRLTPAAPTVVIAAEPSMLQVVRDYLVIGAEHILFGWDHLLFVIALVLLVRVGWAVVKAATAFTLAHSITLVATSLGYAGLPSRPVEALIALSIVFLAVEVAIVLRTPERHTFTRRFPWVVAFAFGLVHGFGFAGALAEIGLPQGDIVTALLAFNLGVEAGQLLIIGGVLALLAGLERALPRLEVPALRMSTYAIGGIASFWLIERVIG